MGEVTKTYTQVWNEVCLEGGAACRATFRSGDGGHNIKCGNTEPRGQRSLLLRDSFAIQNISEMLANMTSGSEDALTSEWLVSNTYIFCLRVVAIAIMSSRNSQLERILGRFAGGIFGH